MIEVLARASLDGAIVVAMVWTLNRALPALPPKVRVLLWWCAAAKVLVSLAWVTPVAVPVLPSAAAAATLASSTAAGLLPVAPAGVPAAHPAESVAVDWTAVLLTTWAFGICASFGLGVRQWRRTREAVVGSVSADAGIQDLAREIAALLSLRQAPEVRLSQHLESPLVTGLIRPTVLVPRDRFGEMPRAQQRMALCHELSHVKRRDLWLGCLPAAAERLFFFHPLVRLAAREYAFWREAACDAAVLSALGTPPQAYGRLLLDLGVARPSSAFSAAGAAWSFSNLKRRIVMLDHTPTPPLRVRLAACAAVLIAVAALVPLKLVARTAPPPAASAVDGALAANVSAFLTQSERQVHVRDEDLRFVFFMGERSTHMSGESGDMDRARRQRTGAERMLWFLADGREYVVRDSAVLDEVERLWEPVSQLGAEQGKIGAKQGTLGAEQGAIGAKQGALGAQQAAIGAKQAGVGAQQSALGAKLHARLDEPDRGRIETQMRELDKAMRELDREMRALDEKMRELDKPMRDLGERMEDHGREMEKLGEKMEAASERATAQMRELLKKAIAAGAARPVR